MRVGIYFHGYQPESGGGYTFKKDILTALIGLASQSHHHFTLFTDNVSSLKLPINTSVNIETFLLKRESRFSYILRHLRRVAQKFGLVRIALQLESPLQKAISQKKIQFIWFPTPEYSPIDIPYIATIWDIQHRVQPWFPEVGNETLWVGLDKYVSDYVQRATYVITPNQVGQNEIAFYFQIPPERFIMLPHPAPKISLHNPTQIDEILEKFHLVRQGYLFYPAQFWPHKNHINLLYALKILREENNFSIPLVLVGSDKGNLHHVLSTAEEMGISDLLHFLGFVPRDDLIGLYQGALALTFLSLFGPENLPPLEAFSCGCPVIVARVAGAEEQYEDSVLMVEGTIPSEIAAAIKSLYTNPKLRERLIKKGRIRSERFTANNYVNGVFAAINKFEDVRKTWGTKYDQNLNRFIKSEK